MPDKLNRINAHDVRVSVPEEYHSVNPNHLSDLISDQKKEVLFRNGLEGNHGKNHVPVAYLRGRKVGYRFLLTELDPQNPHIAFGLCDYDTRLEIGFVDLRELERESEYAEFQLKDEFEGKYNLAVYALVANELGTVVTDDSHTAYGEVYEKYDNELNNDSTKDLTSFESKLTVFSKLGLKRAPSL